MIPETRLTVEESEAALIAAGIDIEADTWSAATFDRALAVLAAATNGKANMEGGNNG